MGDAFRPSGWFTRGGAEVVCAQAFHERQHFEREEAYTEMFPGSPPPPPEGPVVRPVADPPGSHRVSGYSVASRGQQALSALDRIVAEAHGAELLRRAVQWYQQGSDELGRWCLEVGARASVKESVAEFVSTYGPLEWCFGRWLKEGAGNSPEYFVWPSAWRLWALSIFDAFEGWKPVPSPIGFYLWAGLMIQGLREHPEWPGCQLFLANRVSRLSLEFAEEEKRSLVEAAATRHFQSPAVVVGGELLELLAARVAFGWGASSAGLVTRVRTCPICRQEFLRTASHRVYCSDDCVRYSGALRQARYRQNRSLPR